MARKMPRDLLALSSLAVLTVYGAGYGLTQPAVDTLSRLQAPAGAIGATRAGHYRDGTYSATGTSPFGDVAVAVTIRGRRIVAVRITACTTYFPEDWIAGLPQQVVARQSAAVDLVSGATGSTAAFHDAVRKALQQAQA
jgi:fumarate reductase flavoprotein subunit